MGVFSIYKAVSHDVCVYNDRGAATVDERSKTPLEQNRDVLAIIDFFRVCHNALIGGFVKESTLISF